MEQSKRLKQMKVALVDFLLRAHEIPHLVRIVLFGSLLDGDVNKKSDVDLLLVFDSKSNPETGVELKTATKIGIEILNNYQIENNFSFVVVNIQSPSKTDKEFLTETASKGVIVWEKAGFEFLSDHKEMQAQVLFDYSTQNLSPADKRKLLRKIAKVAKLYGKRLGKGVLIIDQKYAKETEEIFKECNANYSKQQIFS